MDERDDNNTEESQPVGDEPTAEQPPAGEETTAGQPAAEPPAEDSPTEPLGDAPPPPPPDSPQPAAAGGGRLDFRKLFRSRDDKVIGGVAGGIGAYFGIDPVIVRIIFVGLTLLGGAGILLYLAGMLLIPEADGETPFVRRDGGRMHAITVAGVVVLTIAACVALAAAGAVIGWILFPLAFLAVVGLLAFWLASGKRPGGSPGEILARAAIGLGILIACGLLAIAGGWAAGTGGGTVAAIIVIASGAVLVTAAFNGGARWFIMPALSLGLAAAFVTAAGIDLDGGVGRKDYRPATVAEVHDKYQVGIGELIVDLRSAHLPAGDTHIKMDVGVGSGVLVVPRDVCVNVNATAGMGAISLFDRDSGGIDVDFAAERSAPSGTPRVVLDGDVGLGAIEVRHTRPTDWEENDGEARFDDFGKERGNFACVGGSASVGSGATG